MILGALIRQTVENHMDRPIPDSTWCYNASTPAAPQMALQHRAKSIDTMDEEAIDGTINARAMTGS